MATEQQIERRIVRRIILDALKAGYSLTVCDGAETVLRQSVKPAVVLDAMFSTGEDVLSFIDAEGKRAGWVLLVYGNGMDVISDYSDNDKTAAILKGADELAQKC